MHPFFATVMLAMRSPPINLFLFQISIFYKIVYNFGYCGAFFCHSVKFVTDKILQVDQRQHSVLPMLLICTAFHFLQQAVLDWHLFYDQNIYYQPL